MCKLLQINIIITNPFHLKTNENLVRSHRTLDEHLRYVNKKFNNWDTFLPYAFLYIIQLSICLKISNLLSWCMESLYR